MTAHDCLHAQSVSPDPESQHIAELQADVRGYTDMLAPLGDEEQEEMEERRPIILRNPAAPSRQEWEEHCATHVPYRSWCPHCVRGRGLADAHRAAEREEVEHPVVSFDYGFLTTAQGEDRGAPLLVGRERRTGMTLAMIVPAKGVAHQWVQERAARWVDSLGYQQVTLRCDQEPAIVALMTSIKENRGDGTQTQIEFAAKGDSQDNGVVEKAVDQMAGMMRTLKSALEHRLECTIDPADRALLWMAEHCAMLHNRFSVGRDGKTPHERWRGWRCKRPICEFGERILYQPHKHIQRGKLDPRFEYGVFVGVSPFSNEVWVSQGEKVLAVRTIRRLPEGERWVAAEVKGIKATPWSHDSPPPDLEPVPVVWPAPGAQAPPPAPPQFAPSVKRVYFRRLDFESHGYTDHCIGCRRLRLGQPAAAHSELCRARMEAALRTTSDGAARVQHAEWRHHQAAFRELEQQESAAKRRRVVDAAEGGGEAEREAERQRHGARVVLAESAESNTQAARSATTAAAASSSSSSSSNTATAPAHSAAAATAASSATSVPPASNKPDPAQDQQPNQPQRAMDDEEDQEQDSKRQRIYNVNQDADYRAACRQPPVPDGCDDPKGKVRADITEVFSPPRIAEVGKLRGWRSGGSLDLTTCDANGERWNFDVPRKRQQALDLVAKTRPRLVIGSPQCTAYSILQNMNRAVLGEERYWDMIRRARKHLAFCCELYELQLLQGRYFLHEHPSTARSWKEACIQRIAHLPRVHVYQADLCAHGMVQTDALGEAPVKKPTKFMTNSEAIGAEVGKRCCGGHRHISLVGGRAKAAQKYPKGLCDAVVRGLEKQMRLDGEDLKENLAKEKERVKKILVKKEYLQNGKGEERFGTYRDKFVEKGAELNSLMHEEIMSLWTNHHWDDAKGGWLDPDLCAKGRAEEMEYIKKHQVYTRVPRTTCWEETGRPPIKTGWAETNKGTPEKPNVRCRWVAKDFKREPRPDLYAPMPPIEALRLVLSNAATGCRKKKAIAVVDVRRAYYYAPSKRRVFVELPQEDWQPGDEDRCGLLRVSLPGNRDSAQNWDEEVGRFFTEELGMVQGKANTCVYRHGNRKLVGSVHGDDCTMSGDLEDVRWFVQKMSSHFEVKLQIIGEAEELSKEAVVLNRTVRWKAEGVELEADARHVKETLMALGLEEANAVATPCLANKDEDKMLESKAVCDMFKPNKSKKRQGSVGHVHGGHRVHGGHVGHGVHRDRGGHVGADRGQVLGLPFGEVRGEAWGLNENHDFEGANAKAVRFGQGGAFRESSGPQEEEDHKGDHFIGNGSDYRAITARLNYLAQDRPDINFATMTVSTAMADPQPLDWMRLKRLGRYLRGKPRAACLFEWQADGPDIHAYADADWGGDRATRRSVSGGCVFVGKHCVKTWSKKQQVIALSTAEAELYAGLRAATEALGIQALMVDLGSKPQVHLHLDASAALSLLDRRGLGKAKHIEMQHLWLQEAVKAGRVQTHKVASEINPADLLTKPLPGDKVEELLNLMQFKYL